MTICYLADAGSVHVQKWIRYFTGRGNEVHLISFRNADIKDAHVHFLNPHGFVSINPVASLLSKMGYLLWTRKIKRLIKKINPDILHAHWATSYGLVGALSRHHPFILSTWGFDVTESPRNSRIMKKIVEYSLKKSDVITATSHMLTSETAKYEYTGKRIHTVPFGVDTHHFTPVSNEPTGEPLSIGIVKALEREYGVEYLIGAFAKVRKMGYNVRLLIVGDGSLWGELKALVTDLKISDSVEFTGSLANNIIPQYLRRMDIFVVPSLSESFGVSALEASACEIPVIASNVGGLPEVVVDGETGYLVPPRNEAAIAEKIIKLIEEPELRQNLGANGRKFVLENYEWNSCARKMEEIYERILK